MLKTLKRKIALVAVAGLGFGLISTVPAFAADGTASADDSTLYSGQTVTITVTDTDLGGDAGAAYAATVASSNANVTLGAVTTTPTVVGGGNTNFTPAGVFTAAFTVTSTPGSAQSTTVTVSYNDGAAATVTVNLAVGATISGVSLAGPVRPNSGQAVDIKLTGTGSINGTTDATAGFAVPNAADHPVRWSNISKPTDSNTPTLTAAAFTTALSSTTAATVGTLGGINVAGTYTGIVFWDDNDNGVANTNEPQFLFTFTTAGAPNAMTATAALPSVGASVNTEIIISLTSAGALTQAINGEFVTIVADPTSATSAVTLSNGLASDAAGSATTLTTPVQGAAGSNASAAIVPAEFADGKASFLVNSNTASDTVTLTITPSAALVAAGATAQTVTIRTVAAASLAAAKVTATTNVNLIVDPDFTVGTTLDTNNENQYIGSVDLKSVTFKVSGLTASASYTPEVVLTGLTTTVKVDGVAYTSGDNLTRTSDASGNDTIVVTWTDQAVNNDTVEFDLDGNIAAADVATQIDALVTVKDFTYTTTLTAPAATLVMEKTGAVIKVEGSVADQFGTPVIGASVSVTGAQTPSTTALTASATTDTTGKFATSITPAAATTKIDLTVAVVKGAIAPANKTATINFSASGSPTAITAVTSPATTTTVIPAVLVAYDGSASNNTGETYTLATATAAATLDATGVDANEECFSITPTTTPTAQVVYTGTAGVKFSTASCAVTATSVASGKDTVTAASGTAVYVFTTKSGLNTVTMTAGDVKTTADFFAVNYVGSTAGGGAVDSKNTKAGAAARNIAITAPASVDTTGIGVATVKVTDAFGNPVEFTNTVTLTAAVTGKALLSGNAVSISIASTDANGEATIAIIGLTTAGDAVLTVTGAAGVAQFGAAAGAATGTTAGTNGLTASVNAPTATIPVKSGAASATQTAETAAIKADVKAVSDTVATLSKAVTTIQSSVTELTTSFTAQIKSLSSAIAKISRAIAALSKKIK